VLPCRNLSDKADDRPDVSDFSVLPVFRSKSVAMKDRRLCRFCETSPSDCGDEYYKPRQQLKISTQAGQITIHQTDRYQCSDEALTVFSQDSEIQVPWMIITDISIDHSMSAFFA